VQAYAGSNPALSTNTQFHVVSERPERGAFVMWEPVAGCPMFVHCSRLAHTIWGYHRVIHSEGWCRTPTGRAAKMGRRQSGRVDQRQHDQRGVTDNWLCGCSHRALGWRLTFSTVMSELGVETVSPIARSRSDARAHVGRVGRRTIVPRTRRDGANWRRSGPMLVQGPGAPANLLHGLRHS
jgi:hypothetical protein